MKKVDLRTLCPNVKILRKPQNQLSMYLYNSRVKRIDEIRGDTVVKLKCE